VDAGFCPAERWMVPATGYHLTQTQSDARKREGQVYIRRTNISSRSQNRHIITSTAAPCWSRQNTMDVKIPRPRAVPSMQSAQQAGMLNPLLPAGMNGGRTGLETYHAATGTVYGRYRYVRSGVLTLPPTRRLWLNRVSWQDARPVAWCSTLSSEPEQQEW
jgi:hypothetical protein